jgi:PTS system cellobiose-specific IIC component
MVPWTTPFFVSGFLMTKSLMGVVAQMISFAAAFLIWLPFIRVWDKKNFEMEKAAEIEETTV